MHLTVKFAHPIFYLQTNLPNPIPITMTFWRAAGLTYINYSTIAARCVRSALKQGADVSIFGFMPLH